MAILLGDNVLVTAGLPIENRYTCGTRPYSACTEVNTVVTSDLRFSGLTVNINGTEYWYKDGLENGDLVEKTTGGGTITGGTNGLSTSGANVVLGGDLTGNTTINTSSHDLGITNLSAKSTETNILYIASDGNLATGSTGSGTVTGATNGLTLSGADIILGGDLTGNTEVELSDYEFDFTSGTALDLKSLNSGTNVNAVGYQSDGKIVIGGSNFSTYDGNSISNLFRINSDGSYDDTFVTGTISGVDTIYVQDDDKVVIGGNFTSVSGETHNRIARLNANGSLDSSFVTGTAFGNTGTFNEYLNSLAAGTSAGKILAGGRFTSYSGATANYLVQLNSNGSIDTGFDTSSGYSGDVDIVITQADNKVVVGGIYATYSGVTSSGLTRLNTDGTLDSSFTTNLGGGFDINGTGVFGLALQPDNKIIVVGGFHHYSGLTKYNVVRLNTDGTLDTGFTADEGFDSSDVTYAVAVDSSDSKVYVVGSFTWSGGTSHNDIVKFNTDGTIDSSFGTSGVTSGSLNIVYSQPDYLFIGGALWEYEGVVKYGMVAVNGDTGEIFSGASYNFRFSGNTLTAPNLTLTNISEKTSETNILYIAGDGAVAYGTPSGGDFAMSGNTANGITTYVDGTTICAEPNFTFNVNAGESTTTISTATGNRGLLNYCAGTSLVKLGFVDAAPDQFTLWDSADNDLFMVYPAGGTELYHNKIKKLETVTGGATITGIACASTCFKAPAITLTTGAASGCVLQSDGSGNATWETPSGGGGIGWSGSTANAIGTYADANGICAEPNLTFDGTILNFAQGASRTICVAQATDGAGGDNLYLCAGTSDDYGTATPYVGGCAHLFGGRGSSETRTSANGGNVCVCGGGGGLSSCCCSGGIGGHVYIRGGTGGLGCYATAPSGTVYLYHGASERLRTTTNGVCVSSTLYAPIVCSTTCVRTAILCATTCASTPAVIATTCVTAPLARINGNIYFCQGTTRCIAVNEATDGGAGDFLAIYAGTADAGANTGGGATVRGGGGGAVGAGTAGTGGYSMILGATGGGGGGGEGGIGGRAIVRGGTGGAGSVGGTGGEVQICGGCGWNSTTDGVGGDVSIRSGYGETTDGTVYMYHDTTLKMNTTITRMCFPSGIDVSYAGSNLAGLFRGCVGGTGIQHAVQGTNKGTSSGQYYGGYFDAYSATPSGSGRSNGVVGLAGNRTGGYNIGVHGMICGSCNGAGVLGSITDQPYPITAGLWAGYFCGAVYGTTTMCAVTAFRSSCTGSAYRFCATYGCGCAVDWVATSDCRLKKDIVPITSALSKVDALCGVCYEFCEDGTLDMGLIAQDVLCVEPRLVTSGEADERQKEKYGIDDKTFSLKYDKFAGLFVEAIKELKAQNESLQLQISELKSNE